MCSPCPHSMQSIVYSCSQVHKEKVCRREARSEEKMVDGVKEDGKKGRWR